MTPRPLSCLEFRKRLETRSLPCQRFSKSSSVSDATAMGHRWTAEVVSLLRHATRGREPPNQGQADLRRAQIQEQPTHDHITSGAMAAFRMQRTRQLEQRLLAGDQWQDWGLVFTSSKGTPLDGPNVNHRLQKLLEQAGLPRQRFHDLRHGCASLLLAAGVPPRTIMGVLGHSQISLTLNTYSHLSPALH